jgi:pyruvate decarboxylase
MDMVHQPIMPTGLRTSIDLTYPVDTDSEMSAVRRVKNAICNATNPVFLVDCLTARHQAVQEARELCELLEIPIFTTPMGKSIINEDHPRFCGVYNGSVSYPGIKSTVESSDCVINLGPMISDSNSGGHTREIDLSQSILIEAATCTVKYLLLERKGPY